MFKDKRGYFLESLSLLKLIVRFSMENNYNFVIFGSEWDLYKTSYSDIIGKENVVYIERPEPLINSGLIKLLFRIHFHKYIFGISLPFKRVWNKYYFIDTFKTKRPLCFVFFNSWIRIDVGLPLYLRKKYPRCKLVWMNQDLIKVQTYAYSNKTFDVEKIKCEFDLCLSFDKGDCLTYGFTYHPLVFSEIKYRKDTEIKSDVYFLGRAKNRLDDIVDVYYYLTHKGLKCDFYIVGVNKEKQKAPDSIHYIESMDYQTNLKMILESKCLLEVMQESGTGFTQRGCEAVCLGKKLLTNNQFIIEEPFYNSKYISTFRSTDDMDEEFVDNIRSNEMVDYHYKDRMSPIELLEFIENHLK